MRRTMDTQMVPYILSAVYLMIALFSLGVLQPIDCKEDKRLLFYLKKETSVEGAANLLDAVENKDEVTLLGVTVRDLLEIRDRDEGDCQPDLLRTADDRIDFFLSRNTGLSTFLDYHLRERAKLCFDRLVKNLKEKIAKKMVADEKNVLDKFWLRFEPFNPFQSRKNFYDLHMTLVVHAWNVLSSVENKMKVKYSCGKLNHILKKHFPSDLWKSYTDWLWHEEVEPSDLINTGMACSIYLLLLEEKPEELAVWYEPVKNDALKPHFTRDMIQPKDVPRNK